jgi:hypothetical protein
MTAFERASEAANVCVPRNPIDQTFSGVAAAAAAAAKRIARIWPTSLPMPVYALDVCIPAVRTEMMYLN